MLWPEFALAMYLCDLKRMGKDLPQTIPEDVANEVSSAIALTTLGAYPTAGLAGRWPLAWAMTKDEEIQYHKIFRASDKSEEGYISHDMALEVMGQSTLSKVELEKIYALVDQEKFGNINTHQFAVAMHVIHRKIKGYALPHHLEPETMLPWAQKLLNTIDNAAVLLGQNGSQHQAHTDHLQECSSCIESQKKTKDLQLILTKKDANIKALLATVKNLRQELASLQGTSPIQPMSPKELVMESILPQPLDPSKGQDDDHMDVGLLESDTRSGPNVNQSSIKDIRREVPLPTAKKSLVVLRASGEWGIDQKEKVPHLMKMMETEVSNIFFADQSLPLEFQQIAICGSATDDNFRQLGGFVTNNPVNEAVLLVMSGPEGISTNLRYWAKFANAHLGKSIYFAVCMQEREINSVVPLSAGITDGDWVATSSISKTRAWTTLSLSKLLDVWTGYRSDSKYEDFIWRVIIVTIIASPRR